MHESILNVKKQLVQKNKSLIFNNCNIQLLIDGNYFNPITQVTNNKLENIVKTLSVYLGITKAIK